MELTSIVDDDSFKAMCEIRDKAFESAGNLDLTREQRQVFSDNAEQLGRLISDFANSNFKQMKFELANSSEFKDITAEIDRRGKSIDWSHPNAQIVNENLGHVSKALDSAKKLLLLFSPEKS